MVDNKPFIGVVAMFGKEYRELSPIEKQQYHREMSQRWYERGGTGMYAIHGSSRKGVLWEMFGKMRTELSKEELRVYNREMKRISRCKKKAVAT